MLHYVTALVITAIKHLNCSFANNGWTAGSGHKQRNYRRNRDDSQPAILSLRHFQTGSGRFCVFFHHDSDIVLLVVHPVGKNQQCTDGAKYDAHYVQRTYRYQAEEAVRIC